jgi:hypothetical protein
MKPKYKFGDICVFQGLMGEICSIKKASGGHRFSYGIRNETQIRYFCSESQLFFIKSSDVEQPKFHIDDTITFRHYDEKVTGRINEIDREDNEYHYTIFEDETVAYLVKENEIEETRI